MSHIYILYYRRVFRAAAVRNVNRGATAVVYRSGP